MPKVSVIILTKNRAELLQSALASVSRQTFRDFEAVVVDDGSTDKTSDVLSEFKVKSEKLKVIRHDSSQGIIKSRQEALEKSGGDLVAFLDDDDEWTDAEKLTKQVRWFEENPDAVICGGGIRIIEKYKNRKIERFRPETDQQIRKWMLYKNPFFTSTVMVKRYAALEAGGFVSDGVDLAEDYDLWLRMGKRGKMCNFQEIFTAYRQPSYNKDKFRKFLRKQLTLIERYKDDYKGYWLASLILRIRLVLDK